MKSYILIFQGMSVCLICLFVCFILVSGTLDVKNGLSGGHVTMKCSLSEEAYLSHIFQVVYEGDNKVIEELYSDFPRYVCLFYLGFGEL